MSVVAEEKRTNKPEIEVQRVREVSKRQANGSVPTKRRTPKVREAVPFARYPENERVAKTASVAPGTETAQTR